MKPVQHLRLQPAKSDVGSVIAAALHALLQDCKSLLQTRTLWLPAPQTEAEGASDCAGGIGLPDPSCGVLCGRRPWLRVCASAGDWNNSKRKRIGNTRFIISLALAFSKFADVSARLSRLSPC
ncbi:MAG: hypothetical protein WAU90_07945, partial [Methyloceanibacter sp.]